MTSCFRCPVAVFLQFIIISPKLYKVVFRIFINMSYERVVIKRGKCYGPYLYESYRDKDGKVKKRYLGKLKKPKKISGKRVLSDIWKKVKKVQ